MNTIFLVGMPGVGKSHWGHIWSKSAGFDFADMDTHVEAQAGVSVQDIFRSIGESGFRVLEAVVLLDTIAAARGRNTIIATGGGTAIFDQNMDTMLRAGFVIYLTASIDTLLKQIRGSEFMRPLFQHLDAATLESMLALRRPFYERAHLTIAVDQLRTDTFAQILNQCISRQS